jgi:AraC-like DNA-binding protein/CheY-like chemotaxis protein
MKQKILIIEDELIIANHLRVILENKGFDCSIGIRSVKEAREAINNIDFNLVLIDVKLINGLDGTYIGKELLKKDIIPYVYITGSNDLTTINKIKETRPHGIIIKPFKNIDIITTVELVLSNFKYKKIDVVRNLTNPFVKENPFIIKEVTEYINENICEKIEISTLAKIAKWSEQHFIREFTKHMERTPYQYILHQKIEKAKVILAETNKSITYIAYDLGFSSYSNFCVAFKKETGITPIDFKNKIKIKKHLQ